MSDLEEKGYLFHPHTSAGRIPTDMAYRVYVDSLMRVSPVSTQEKDRLYEHVASGGTAIESILRRAAQMLGVLTQELGVAVGPRIEEAVLERLELIRVSAERMLLVLRLRGGAVHSIFVEVRSEMAETALAAVALVLNERLAGLSLRQIRQTIPDRLRDAPTPSEARELLNIFVQEGDHFFDVATASAPEAVMVSGTSKLVEQPEFASGEAMRRLLQLTDMPSELATLLRARAESPGLTITIGNEHSDPTLATVHRRDVGVPRGPADGRDWGDRPDADAVRQDRLAGESYVEDVDRAARLRSRTRSALRVVCALRAAH